MMIKKKGKEVDKSSVSYSSSVSQSKVSDNNESRIVFFTGYFEEEKTEKTIERMIKLEAEDPKKDIILFINSYGGYVDELIAIYDVIKGLNCKVATVCSGKAMSCGCILLMAGTKGHRYITKNSRVLLHEIASLNIGTLSELHNQLQENDRMQNILNNIILENTKITEKELKGVMSKDSYFNADEAVKVGIVDHILESSINMYKKLNI